MRPMDRFTAASCQRWLNRLVDIYVPWKDYRRIARQNIDALASGFVPEKSDHVLKPRRKLGKQQAKH